MGSLLWKLNRLRAMSLSEILYRLQKVIQARSEILGFNLPKSTTPILTQSYFPVFISVRVHKVDYFTAAGSIMDGYYSIFAQQSSLLGFPPDWNRDPFTGIVTPMIFGKTLNYRDESLVGNIKYLWEPNRHLELVTLAQAYHCSKDPKYAQGCQVLLDSWFAACPYPLGPNWTSSLEHAVRLVNWAFAWHLLGGENGVLFASDTGQSFKEKWLTSIHQHCHFIAGHFSLYSSANNHLFGEYMGLFVGATLWPCWPESGGWQKKAQAGLEEEALKQNAPDGSNREQGIWYHHEVADMMFICGLVGRANGREFSPEFWQRLESMLDFLAAMMDVGSNMPMIGDSDDGVMARLCPDLDFHVFRSQLATGAVLFNRPDLARKAGEFDDKSRWLLGGEGETKFSELLRSPYESNKHIKRAFPDGGYWILGRDFETKQEVKLIVDAGPLGYLSIAAHGHADALAIYLSIAGQEIFIDPGTYAYHTERKWRDYFKGTSAHNTLRIDGVDQSVSGGNFMWLKHARAWCESFETGENLDVFIGAHDGYTRLRDPVTHRRSIEVDKKQDRITVLDFIDCKKEHQAEIFWHFAENCLVQIENRKIKVQTGNVEVTLTMPESDWMPMIFTGNEELPLGWISRRFDRKEPTTTVVWAGDVGGKTELKTMIEYHIEHKREDHEN